MKRNITLTLILLFSSVNTFSQADTLNQLDSKGKKTGWCIAYLDENLKVMKDSIGATHSMYNYYVNGAFLYRFGEGYGSKKSPVIFPKNDTLKLGDYTLLNGIYITKYENGSLRSELITSKGHMTSFKRYYPTGKLKFEVIVSNDCGAPLQHCLTEYNKDGSVKYEGHTFLPKEK